MKASPALLAGTILLASCAEESEVPDARTDEATTTAQAGTSVAQTGGIKADGCAGDAPGQVACLRQAFTLTCSKASPMSLAEDRFAQADDTAPGDTALDDAPAVDTAPGHTVPDDTAPDDTAPDDIAP